MYRRRMLSLTLVGFIGFCAASTARADELLKFRLVMHAITAQSQEVGDVDGHVLGVAHYSGLASLAGGCFSI